MRFHDDRLHLSPSDVTAFLACEHLTTLSLAHARGELERPEVENEQAELIFRKGLEHERAYLEQPSRARGRPSLEIRSTRAATGSAPRARPPRRCAPAWPTSSTRASSPHDGWRGVADFLLRVEPSTGGPTRRSTPSSRARAKPAYILQLCFYNEQLARIQGRAPEQIHVLLGSGEQASFRPEEFGAYYRRVRSRLEQFVADPPPTEPYPVDHCGICDFKPICDAYWDEVDHLSPRRRRPPDADREARGRRDHDARRSSAARRPSPCPPGIPPTRSAKIREQAELQLLAREHGSDSYRLLQPQPEAGFALLPEPSPGDLFFDFEGNPFWDKDGCARVPLGDPRRRRATSRRCTRTTTRPSGVAFETVRRPRARAARALPRPARLPLRRLRDHRAQAADGPLRHARGASSTTCSAASVFVDLLQGRPQRPPRLAAAATG